MMLYLMQTLILIESHLYAKRFLTRILTISKRRTKMQQLMLCDQKILQEQHNRMTKLIVQLLEIS